MGPFPHRIESHSGQATGPRLTAGWAPGLLDSARSRYPACGSRRATDRWQTLPFVPHSHESRSLEGGRRDAMSGLSVPPGRDRRGPVAERLQRRIGSAPRQCPLLSVRSEVGPAWQRAEGHRAVRVEPPAPRASGTPARVREAGRVPGPTYPYSCPVCGVGLIQSDLQWPDEGYFCPYSVLQHEAEARPPFDL